MTYLILFPNPHIPLRSEWKGRLVMEAKPFEIRVGGRELKLELGKCACVLFREQQEIDYLAIDTSEPEDEDRTTLRIFNNVQMVRWMAGLALTEDGTPYQVAADNKLFRDEYGWNPPVILKNAPNNDELEWWLDVQTRDLEKEWNNGF
jgi:hypothetical protein